MDHCGLIESSDIFETNTRKWNEFYWMIMISQFYLGDKEIVYLILSLQDTNNWSLRHLQVFLKTIFQTLCANLSVSNSYHDHYSLSSSSYYLHNEFSQSLFLNVRISVGYQIYYIARRTGHQSRLRVFKRGKSWFFISWGVLPMQTECEAPIYDKFRI